MHKRDRSQLAIAYAAALLLHCGLVAALIIGQTRPLNQSPDQPAISLLLQPAPATAHRQVNLVQPRPRQVLAVRPAAPAIIANAARLPASKLPKPQTPTAAAQTQAAPASPKPSQVAAGGFVAAAPLTGDVNAPPEYPQDAITHGEQGSVLLSIHVLPDGTTDSVSVTQSSGYRVLDRSAADAVLHWRFQPASIAGKKVVEVIPEQINFDLMTQSVQDAAPGH